MEKENVVAKWLRWIGMAIMIGGFLLAVNFGGNLSILFSSLVSGMLFIGFAEVITLLQKILFQLQQDSPNANSSSSQESVEEQQREQKEWHLSKQDQEDIQELYKNQKITNIEASPFEDYCIVQIEGENHIDVVELGGFKPKKVSFAAEPELVNDIQKWYYNRFS